MRKDYLLVGGFSALAAFAAAGWMRPVAPIAEVTPMAAFQPLGESTADPSLLPPVTLASDSQVLTPATRSAVYREAVSAPVRAERRTVARRSEPAARVRPVAYSQDEDQEPRLRTRDRRSIERDDDVYRSEPEIRERSKGKSIAIVAGSAAAGAAIGAATGGGKGAAIGAIAGGAGGYVYDRMTKRKEIDPDDQDYRESSNVYRSDDYRGEDNSRMKTVGTVAGSAAAGATIGAMTGGGKGAAIGAVAGGAGGYIYDRMKRRR